MEKKKNDASARSVAAKKAWRLRKKMQRFMSRFGREDVRRTAMEMFLSYGRQFRYAKKQMSAGYYWQP